MSSSPPSPHHAAPHPAVWRASQLSAGDGRRCLDTGHPALSAELPGGGWPCGSLTEFLAPRAGIGEVHLLLPALAALPADRCIALVQPPHVPNAVSWLAWGLDAARLLWLRPQTLADALWSADQVLKSGSCAALLCWLPHVRADALRRLHAAAQGSDTLFVAVRPQEAARQSSPAPLRLALTPAPGGLLVRMVKRRGPPRDLPLHVPLHAPVPPSSLPFRHAPVDRRPSEPAESGRPASALVG